MGLVTYAYFTREIGMQLKAQKKSPAITSSFIIAAKRVMTSIIEG